eukprot:gene11326-3360_t
MEGDGGDGDGDGMVAVVVPPQVTSTAPTSASAEFVGDRVCRRSQLFPESIVTGDELEKGSPSVKRRKDGVVHIPNGKTYVQKKAGTNIFDNGELDTNEKALRNLFIDMIVTGTDLCKKFEQHLHDTQIKYNKLVKKRDALLAEEAYLLRTIQRFERKQRIKPSKLL